jgi:RNA polymerase sigma-70 factor, ECF subfamily
MQPGIEGSRRFAAEPSSVSSTLLYQIRARQPEAWQRLVHLYGPVVYRWCRQLGVSKTDAADVVQDVFAAVAAGIRQFHRDKQGGSFGAWLRTITRHKVCDHFRRLRGKPNAEGGTNAYRQLLNQPESLDESSIAASRLETDRLFARRVLDVVRAEFQNTTWDVFWRIVVDGQSPAEVAESLGLSLAAVYKAKSRVLLRLRREVKDSME